MISKLPEDYHLIGGYLIGPGVSLEGADLSGLDLSATHLYGVQSQNIVGEPSALPPDYVVLAGYLIGPGVNLNNRNLSGLNLNTLNLSMASFYMANLENASLRHANLSESKINAARLTGSDLTGIISGGISASLGVQLPAGYSIVNGYIVGPGVNLTHADFGSGMRSLAGRNISGSDLRWAKITGTNLSNTNMEGVMLEGVISGGLSGSPLNLHPDYGIIGGYLIGPGVNLNGADLEGLNLSTAQLSRVISGEITGTPQAMPPGYLLVSGFIVGPEVNLNREDLSGLDLGGLNLSHALMDQTVLFQADLSGSNLIGIDLSQAVLDEARAGELIGLPLTLPIGYLIEGQSIVRMSPDRTPPNIQLAVQSPLPWQLGQAFVPPPATAFDERDGDLSSSIHVESNVRVDLVEEGQWVVYSVEDAAGNQGSFVLRVDVLEDLDLVSPVQPLEACVEFEHMEAESQYSVWQSFYADVEEPNIYNPEASLSFYIKEYVNAHGNWSSDGNVRVTNQNNSNQGNSLEVANALLEIIPQMDVGYYPEEEDTIYDPTNEPFSWDNNDPHFLSGLGSGADAVTLWVRDRGSEISLSVNGKSHACSQLR